MRKNNVLQTPELSPTEEAHLQVIDECRGDPALFGMTFFKNTAFEAPFSQIHLDLIDVYLDDDVEKAICLAPRFHGKSAIGAFLLPLHASIYHPHIINGGLQIIASEIEDYAIDRLATIKEEIEFNVGLNDVYGSLKGRKWGEKQFDIRGEYHKVNSKMYARGSGQAFQGVKKGHRRPYFIWCDDAESRDDSKNPELVKKNLAWIDNVVERSLDKINNGRLFYIATMMAENSMTHIIAQRKSWYTLLYSCMKEDGTMIWPEGYSAERFARDYEEAILEDRITGFWLEMMNVPYDTERKELRPEHIIYFSEEDLKQEGEETTLMHNYILIDPSFSSSKESDITGITIIGINDRKEYFIHDVIYSNAKDEMAIVDEIIPFIGIYKPVSIHIESFGAQQKMPKLMKYFLTEEQVRVPVYGMRGSQSKGAKVARIRSFMTKIKQGKVFFNRKKSPVRRMVRDFIAFPHKLQGGDYDVIDSSSYAPIVCIAPRVIREKRQESDWEYMQRRAKEIGALQRGGEQDGRI